MSVLSSWASGTRSFWGVKSLGHVSADSRFSQFRGSSRDFVPPTFSGTLLSQSWCPGQGASWGRKTQEAVSLSGDSGLAKEYRTGRKPPSPCSRPPEALSVLFSWGRKIPKQAHLRLQRRFLSGALSPWSRSSRLCLWEAAGSFWEPSGFHRPLQCEPNDTGLWWRIPKLSAYASSPV